MMADMRIEPLPATRAFDDDNAENWFSDVTSKLDLAKILIMKDCKNHLAQEILQDLYLGKHPLCALFKCDGSIDLKVLRSQEI